MSDAAALAKTALEKLGIPGLLIVPGAVLFLPDSVVTTLGLIAVRDSYRAELGVAFLVGVALLVGTLKAPLLKGWLDWRKAGRLRRRKAEMAALLGGLDEDPRSLLIDGVVNGGRLQGPGCFDDVMTGRQRWEAAVNLLFDLGLLRMATTHLRDREFWIKESHLGALRALVEDDQRLARRSLARTKRAG